MEHVKHKMAKSSPVFNFSDFLSLNNISFDSASETESPEVHIYRENSRTNMDFASCESDVVCLSDESVEFYSPQSQEKCTQEDKIRASHKRNESEKYNFVDSESDPICLSDESIEFFSPQNDQKKIADEYFPYAGNNLCNIIRKNIEVKKRSLGKTELMNFSYSKDIYLHLKIQELKNRPSLVYASSHLLESGNARNVIIDLIINVSLSLELEDEVFHLAVTYMDRFLSTVFIEEGRAGTVGLGCLLIAIKYDNADITVTQDLFELVLDICPKKELKCMEMEILSVLSFELNDPTIYNFLRYFCYSMDTPPVICCFSHLMTEIAFKNLDVLLMYLPSEIAAAALYAAYFVSEISSFKEDLEMISGYQAQQLMECGSMLYKIFLEFRASPSGYLYEKFKSEDYMCISNIVISKTET